ncbi:COR domain-containing protein [Candidatus Parabeggiatoa sp. HSG14]|uniref:COR domain-containing protein n=1 Tax=Candidatus Parabeggiatoa sp. HSG14 TaxID=3055593 RepID=UPI0025A6A595|nr:COR domain-containing protein [Thiotrichales bacterium HSG14]
MPSDLAIIKKLEKKLGIKFEPTFSKKIELFESSMQYEINDAKQVIKLRLCRLELQEVLLDISQLQNLQQLDLSCNQLTTWPVEMAQLQNLQQLFLWDNQLTVWPVEMAQLQNLQLLHLLGNQLTTWPVEMAQLQNLQKLYVSSNQLIAWPKEMAQLQNLQRLYLSYNQLSEWPKEMAQLQNLQQLKLWDNQLTTWPVEMAQLQNLQQLDLSRNQLTAWPVEMAQLEMEVYWEINYTKKSGIFLKDNPLENPPPEIIKQGRTAVIEYFNAGEKQRLNEVKVLLIGDGGAGKTSLVKQLREQQFNPNESQTKGIQINDWEVVDITHCEMTADEQTIKVHLWDFGGQEIMHATHQFFLSKRSIYILVLDGRKDEKTEYWLKYIESFGGDSPILVVLNKIDQNPAFEVNGKSLRDKYQGIQDFYRISCETNEGIEGFRTAFQRALSKIEIRRIYWPTTWFQVKTQLEQMSEPYIDYAKYAAICKNSEVTEKTQEILLKYLCSLGVTLHFKELFLENTHVLEPKWVTKAVYKIINARQVTDKQGILDFNDLEAILHPTEDGDYHYPRDQYPYIVGLMEKFELCYALNKQQVLIPDLLPVEEPDFNFDKAQALQFRIDYNFLPRSVMPRFIVNMHPDIQDELRWRTGVVLKDEKLEAMAVVKSDDEARQLSIAVTGSQQRDYFAIILKTLRNIHDSFEKITIDERVCLPDNPEITVPLKHLYDLEKMGESTVIPEGSQKKYKVRELLEGMGIKQNREEPETLKKMEEQLERMEEKLDKPKPSFTLSGGIIAVNNPERLFEKFSAWTKASLKWLRNFKH